MLTHDALRLIDEATVRLRQVCRILEPSFPLEPNNTPLFDHDMDLYTQRELIQENLRHLTRLMWVAQVASTKAP